MSTASSGMRGRRRRARRSAWSPAPRTAGRPSPAARRVTCSSSGMADARRSLASSATRAIARRWSAVRRADAPRTTRASGALIGIAAMRSPIGVTVPSAVIAPSDTRLAVAASHAGSGGVVTHDRAWRDRAPQTAEANTTSVRSARSISGRSNSSRERCSVADHSAIARPGAVRPERPARCVAVAAETRSTARRDNPVEASVTLRRMSP